MACRPAMDLLQPVISIYFSSFLQPQASFLLFSEGKKKSLLTIACAYANYKWVHVLFIVQACSNKQDCQVRPWPRTSIDFILILIFCLYNQGSQAPGPKCQQNLTSRQLSVSPSTSIPISISARDEPQICHTLSSACRYINIEHIVRAPFPAQD